MTQPKDDPPQPGAGQRRRKVLGAAMRLVGPAILVAVIWRVDLHAVLLPFRSAAWAPLAGALALNVVCNHFKVLRWKSLLRSRGKEYPLGRAWSSFLSSLYVGMLTPGRVGDVLRVQYLRHDVGLPYAEGLAIVVMDRLCDLYVLVAFVTLGVLRFSQVLIGQLAYVTWGGVLLTALGPLVLLVPGLAEAVMSRIYKKIAKEKSDSAGTPRTPGSGFVRFLTTLRALVGRRLVWPLVLSFGAFVINYVQGYLAARALHLDISLYDVACLMAIASLLGLLPISISGVGVRELFFSLVFPVLGCAPEAGVSYGLLLFATIYLAVVIPGFVSWQIAPPPTGPAPSA